MGRGGGLLDIGAVGKGGAEGLSCNGISWAGFLSARVGTLL